jgi:hypothetical protein
LTFAALPAAQAENRCLCSSMVYGTGWPPFAR